MTLQDDLALARRLADAADSISLRYYRKLDLVVETKPDRTPVTEGDKAVEQAIRDLLHAERPDDAVIGEEFGTTGSNDRTWIIDPIDGTKNFLRGVPVWSTLIGLRIGTQMQVGFVSAPALARRWWAATGMGAWTSAPELQVPTRISVSGVNALEDASFAYSDAVAWPPAMLAALTERTWRQRGYGDFWSHMLVAEGAADIAAEPELATYDMAALLPIVREAGGRVTGFAGGDPLADGNLISTNGLLHEQVLDLR